MKSLSFSLACYSTARSTKDLVESSELRAKTNHLLKDLGVEKIYLESYRSFLLSPDELREIKSFFESEGLLTSGGVCIGVWGKGFGERSINLVNRTKGNTICLSAQASRKGLKKIMETTAKVFDEILIDDFWANFCYCNRCLKLFKEQYGFEGGIKDLILGITRNDPKVVRDWEKHSLKLVKETSKKYVIEPAKRVNPRAKIILKVAEWYEKFSHRGIPLKEVVSLFDGLYVGTESRENTSRYGSYFLPQYARKIAKEKYVGAWFDTLNGYNYAVPISEQIYIEQARMSILGQSSEITLFCLRDLLNPRKAEHVSRLRKELPALKQISAAIFARKPLGISVLKPHSSPHVTCHPETYIFDIIGTIGIPLNPTPKFSSDDKNLLITAHGASDLNTSLLKDARNIILTSGAVFQIAKEKNVDVLKVAGLDLKNPIGKDYVHAKAITLVETSSLRIIDHRRSSSIPFGPTLNASEASPLVIAHGEEDDYLVATKNVYGDLNVYCLSFTWFPWYLKLGYIEPVRQIFRDIVGEILGFKIEAQGEGLGNITLHAYEGGIFAVNNLDNTYFIINLCVNPSTVGLNADKIQIRDFMSDHRLPSRYEKGWIKASLELHPAQLTVLKSENGPS